MQAAQHLPETDPKTQLDLLLEQQRNAFAREPMPTLEKRRNRLDRLHNMILDYRERISLAAETDFSSRPRAETELAEIGPLLEGIAYYRKRLKGLMKSQKRHASLLLMPAKVEVRYQPKGVVGIVVPWNFPTFLALSPLVGALAAGNRAMLKASEFAPASAALLQEMISKTFAQDEVCVVTGGVDVASAFTQLPFDHLVFTGSTGVGRKVMAATAQNLTPVTLELGGKSPVILHDDYPIKRAVPRIAFGKGINAGQVCVSPDYVLCPRDKVNEFCSEFITVMSARYPSLLDNPDYTGIITEAQKARLQRYLDDAIAKGARLMTINPQNESLQESRKFPMTLVVDVSDDMLVMREEIFGPILPVAPYDTLDEAIDYVNARERPLALYYFDENTERANAILRRTHSGGACINDTMSHVMADDIPFGGIGASGMGHYHGKEGFLTFSKAKGVVRKGLFDATTLIGPPWNNTIFSALMWMQKWRFRRRNIQHCE